MKKFYLYLILQLTFFLITPAHAYLDPGTGSIILQAILGLIAAAFTTMSFYWGKIKLYFNKLFKKRPEGDQD